MSKDDKLELEGIVTKKLKGSFFEVELENQMKITCTLSGKLNMNKIRILPNDKVTVAISPYDLTRGIITWRHK